MISHILLCLVGLSNTQAFHVAGDCRNLMEGLSSWEGGDSWGMKAATMGSSDWSLLLEFDRPLQGLQVYNGDMDSADMRQFKIKPEKYLKHHTGPVDVSFLVKYEANNPAKLNHINVNGKTHYCREDLGKLTGNPRSGRVPGRGGAQFRGTKQKQEKISTTGDVVISEKTIQEASTQIECADDSTTCTKISKLIFKDATFACPEDVFPDACKLLGMKDTATKSTACGANEDFSLKFCYKSCFCGQ